ncbi:hypothetical protein AXF42_Ash016220 [Apostasia shenzhenica]|uniref:Uncharacterized protein n=1 Tax=Apostasia shenzhenica TaxID=1088818 RepID=A0A2I0AEW1_9ASPA|nr:hypothetical protein AXF42_Ash016220 [Apostasia shenzhenica]
MSVIETINEFAQINKPTTRIPRTTYDRPYPGKVYIQEIINGHEIRAYNCFCMSTQAFVGLRDIIVSRGILNDTRFMPATEQLVIFLRVVAQAYSYHSVCEFFQNSLETVSRNFNHVLQGILLLKDEYITLPNLTVPCHPHIKNNSNFYPYFKDILGAIDGTHIPAIVSRQKHRRYRNRKNFISQNVMATVSFDRQFVYVATGWEGSAADMRILKWTLEKGGFSVPPRKMYLVDSGYANMDKFLAPIRRCRYHLSNYRSSMQRRYEKPQELCNHRHAQLRNVIERTFGILKEWFKVLTDMKPFPFKVKADIVLICCILHNYIGRYYKQDTFFNMRESDMQYLENHDEMTEVDASSGQVSIGEQHRGEIIRTNIIEQLWINNVGAA